METAAMLPPDMEALLHEAMAALHAPDETLARHREAVATLRSAGSLIAHAFQRFHKPEDRFGCLTIRTGSLGRHALVASVPFVTDGLAKWSVLADTKSAWDCVSDRATGDSPRIKIRTAWPRGERDIAPDMRTG